ncbi:LOW QUALITY PROTEIN: NADPH oxidase 5-like [Hipposideros larvatus]
MENLTIRSKEEKPPGLAQHRLALAEFKVQWENQVESCLARPENPSRIMPRAKLPELEGKVETRKLSPLLIRGNFLKKEADFQNQGLQPQPIYSRATAQGAVASNKDLTVELTLYRSEGTPNRGHEGLVHMGTKDRTPAQATSPALTEAPPTGSKHAVLIRAGVGGSPFASVLQGVMYRHQKRKHICPNRQRSWVEGAQDDDVKRHKVDFNQINQDQWSFEWLVSLLTKLEMDKAEETQEGFLELQVYMTSALSKNDMKAIGLQMALNLLAKKEKKDSVTGLQTRTQPGQPDWNRVFQKAAAEENGKGQVFPALAKVLKGHCEQYIWDEDG